MRDLIAEAGLVHTQIPDSTRRFFSYIAGAPHGVDLGWDGMQRLEQGWKPYPPRAALNDVETMASTAAEMAAWYREALSCRLFEKAETLREFKRIQAMADALPLMVPADTVAYGKGGSIDWEDFHCLNVAGQMIVRDVPVTFCFTINWTGPDAGVAAMFGKFRELTQKARAAATPSPSAPPAPPVGIRERSDAMFKARLQCLPTPAAGTLHALWSSAVLETTYFPAGSPMSTRFSNTLRPLASLIGCALASAAFAATPTFQDRTCPVRLDGTRLGADLTPGGSSLRNTIAYEPSTHLYHLWVLANDDTNFPTTSALPYFTHATSTDGLHFTNDGTLHYEIGSADWTSFGSSIDPPLDFVRAAFNDESGTWKLFAWTENVTNNGGPDVGLYNYNTSVNDFGGVASNTYALHQGPLNSPLAGNHVGTFGLVDGKLYLRVDSEPGTFGGRGGGIGQLDYTDAVPPSTSASWAKQTSSSARRTAGS